MAYLRTERGLVNLATAVRVERADEPGFWWIIDADSERRRFKCSDDDIEAWLNPTPPSYHELENIAFQLDRIADLLESIIFADSRDNHFLRTLDIGRD
jgi:hypothetical protein